MKIGNLLHLIITFIINYYLFLYISFNQFYIIIIFIIINKNYDLFQLKIATFIKNCNLH